MVADRVFRVVRGAKGPERLGEVSFRHGITGEEDLGVHFADLDGVLRVMAGQGANSQHVADAELAEETRRLGTIRPVEPFPVSAPRRPTPEERTP